MATIDSSDIILQLIAADGYTPGEARVVLIVEYMTLEGATTWGVTWADESPTMQRRYLDETQFVRQPRILWQPDGAPTAGDSQR